VKTGVLVSLCASSSGVSARDNALWPRRAGRARRSEVGGQAGEVVVEERGGRGKGGGWWHGGGGGGRRGRVGHRDGGEQEGGARGVQRRHSGLLRRRDGLMWWSGGRVVLVGVAEERGRGPDAGQMDTGILDGLGLGGAFALTRMTKSCNL
jgi:hypothetical protein